MRRVFPGASRLAMALNSGNVSRSYGQVKGRLFDTAHPGNRNIGHEYGTELSVRDRMALLEYLKTK